jgi:hypothetical protein
MLYPNASTWRDAPEKRIMLFAMSGLGKTYVSNMLREAGSWFHYSVDYRIGTRYMGEHIADNFKREAMRVPLLRELLLSDSVFIQSNITFENLAPLSTYLGKPGNPDLGGVPFKEYMRRQALHRQAEINAMLDTRHFIGRSNALYGYGNFVCDCSGSICEVVNPDDPEDPVLNALSEDLLMVWIKGDEHHADELARRFDRDPKPMYYQPAFLETKWTEYLERYGVAENDVNPDAFVRWTYAEALAHRQPRYEAMAQNWGITLAADDVAAVRNSEGLTDLISQSLEARSTNT